MRAFQYEEDFLECLNANDSQKPAHRDVGSDRHDQKNDDGFQAAAADSNQGAASTARGQCHAEPE